MSRYVRKHKRHLFGIAFPALILMIVGIIGIQVYPGWIQVSYSTPGADCSTDPSVCDPCNLEFCNGTVCENTFGSTNPNATPTPACPEGAFMNEQMQPSCWTECTVGPNSQAICSPSDAFCNGISGGDDVTNLCRSGTCTTVDTFTALDPSGCDFTFDSGDPLCINCEPPLPSGVTNCGNGVCEIDNGETFATCSLDCRVPGWDGPLLPADSNPNNVCSSIPTIELITFTGPPFNDFPFSGICEDGDICTDNDCVAGVCQPTAKSCDDTIEDFCCPAGCTSENDLDCLPPEDCSIPTPTPTVTPIAAGIVQGSGQVFNCSFLSGSAVSTLSGLKYLVLMMVGLSSLIFFRSRAKG